MYVINGAVTGVAPVLFNRRVTDPEEDGPSRKMTPGEKIVEAEQKVYTDADGLYWPAWNLKKAILDGCRVAGLKDGRKSLTGVLQASIFPVLEPRFGVKAHDGMLEVLGRVPPRTGSQVLIRRPKLDTGWVLTFAISVVNDRLHPAMVRESLEQAGVLVGIGSWRPDYGRFLVTSWEVAK